MKSFWSKGLLIIFSLTFCENLSAEIIKIRIYFDKNWTVCRSGNASYYRDAGWDTEINSYSGEFSDYTMKNIKICNGTYERGEKSGDFNLYYETGSLKTSAKFAEDKPEDQWCWYYPDNKIHFKLNFDKDDFNITELYDRNGKPLLENTADFVFEFKNDTASGRIEIRGTLKNGRKEGVWRLLQNGNTLALDVYRGNIYLRSALNDRTDKFTDKKIIKNSFFIPFPVTACEELNLNSDISELDYPFLSFRFPWAPIDIAVGLTQDSSIVQPERKPMYLGGLEALNKIIAQNVELTAEAMVSNKKWGSVFFKITIDENGFISDKSITKSPDSLLNGILLSALNHLSRFRPAWYNGHPIKSQISSMVIFTKPESNDHEPDP